jgi:predicted DNA-binding transcriptional regulator AlpA
VSATNSKLVIGGETYLTAKQTAALVGFPYRQLWTRQSRGTLPSPDVNLGHKPLWKEQTVIDWLDKREKAHD